MKKGVIVHHGDSRIRGWNGYTDTPIAGFMTSEYPIIIHGYDGLQLDNVSGTSALTYPADLNELKVAGGRNVIVYWGLFMDAWENASKVPVTVEQVYQRLIAYCEKRRTDGWEVIVCTEVSLLIASDGDFDMFRWELNKLVRANWKSFADGMADLGADPILGPLGACPNSEYFYMLHETEAGYKIIARIVQEAQNKLLGDVVTPPATTVMQRLKTAGHNLVTEDGKRFVWLGDTGWELFYKLTIPEVDRYFDNRISKGYNGIQCMLIDCVGVIDQIPANLNGEKPFYNNNPDTPNMSFWNRVDAIIARAEAKGLYLWLCPSWGMFTFGLWSPNSPILFPLSDPEIAYRYANWVSRRYQNYTNLLWMIGGDQPADYCADSTDPRYIDNRPVWDAMAHGIKDSIPTAVLTYHSGCSVPTSRDLIYRTWLDITGLQSGHVNDARSYETIETDYKLLPVRPTFNYEPAYENLMLSHIVNGTHVDHHICNAFDVRKQIWWCMISGAMGHTYGNINVCMFAVEPFPYPFLNKNWIEALDEPGAGQMQYATKLMSELGDILPDNSLVVSGMEPGIVACRNNDTIVVYMAVGKLIVINPRCLPNGELVYFWLNPRTGILSEEKKTFTFPTIGFTAPTEEDWVLIVKKSEMEKTKKIIVVTAGDSRTVGFDGVDSHPYGILLTLNEDFAFINEAVGGSVTGDLIWRATETVDPHLIPGAENILVVWAGINDIGHSRWYLPAIVPYQNLKQYCQERRDKGWKVVICTETSIGATGPHGECDMIRIALNDMIRSNWSTFADGLADLGNDLRIGGYLAYANKYYFDNEVHLTEAGTKIVAEIVSQVVNSLISKPIITPEMETNLITAITATSAITGSIAPDGTYERGVCWAPETDYPDADGHKHTSDGSGAGAYVSKLTGLLPDTRYFVRAYSKTPKGIVYSIAKAFRTPKADVAIDPDPDIIAKPSIYIRLTVTGSEYEGILTKV